MHFLGSIRTEAAPDMDITPLIPAGRQIIETYGEGRFRISGVVYEGSVIVFPDHVILWPVAAIANLAPSSLAMVQTVGTLLLVGCGQRLVPLPPAVRAACRAAGLHVEAMDSGAACRTYNVLLAEGRQVCAALIAV
ncbi:MAG: hypothetical protein FD153_1859 [Rhodospirillaceae bacterium]|nr:MAG: hypothetical protein FD153_1859 [Rhodospirillaceae bacterium]